MSKPINVEKGIVSETIVRIATVPFYNDGKKYRFLLLRKAIISTFLISLDIFIIAYFGGMQGNFVKNVTIFGKNGENLAKIGKYCETWLGITPEKKCLSGVRRSFIRCLCLYF